MSIPVKQRRVAQKQYNTIYGKVLYQWCNSRVSLNIFRCSPNLCSLTTIASSPLITLRLISLICNKFLLSMKLQMFLMVWTVSAANFRPIIHHYPPRCSVNVRMCASFPTPSFSIMTTAGEMTQPMMRCKNLCKTSQNPSLFTLSVGAKSTQSPWP